MKELESALAVWPTRRFVWILLALMILWRAAIAALLPVTQDEAYYFDWARSLAWGYFDHPPGVALLGIGTWLAPGSVLAARLGGLLAGVLTLWILLRLYRHCGLIRPADTALALLLAFATLPGLAGGVLTTPDTALMLAWALALHEAERALAGQRRRWLSAGLAVGLGLLCKYTMVLIGPVLLLAILWADRRVLRSPWPYLGALLALLVFLPNLLWNAQHDWLALRFQFGHGFSTALFDTATSAVDHDAPRGGYERIASLLGYFGIQLGLWGALLVPLLLAPWNRPARACPHTVMTMHARRLLWAAAVFPVLFFGLLALFSEVEANWPGMYLLAAAPLAALYLRRLRVWAFAAAGVNLLLVSLYAIHAATGILPLADGQNRILRETHGFDGLAGLVAQLDAPVYADRYQTTAVLRFYGRSLDDDLRSHRLRDWSGRISQWPGLARSSEYALGQIAPLAGPDQPAMPDAFWLVARRRPAPAIAGYIAGESRTLYDCPHQPVQALARPPCRQPLHRWELYRYQRVPALDR